MIFFEGGFTYNDLMEMPLSELYEWFDIAQRISKEQSKAIKNASSSDSKYKTVG